MIFLHFRHIFRHIKTHSSETRYILTALSAGIFLLFFISSVSAYPLQASLDNYNYVQGEKLVIEGEVDANESVQISAGIYSSSGNLMNSSSTISSGAFAIENKINESYSPGSYYVGVTSGDDVLNLSFEVITERITPELNLITGTSQDDFIAINTSKSISDATPLEYDNLTEMTDKSKSSTVHYGNQSVNGTQYYFVLVDKNSEGIYDTLYVDDDKDFRLYNFTEDNSTYPMVEQEFGMGDTFEGYMVGHLDIMEGNNVFLGKPAESTTFAPGDNISFVAMIKNDTQHIKTSEPVFIDLAGTTQNITDTTDEMGYYLGNFTAPTETGAYTIEVNGTPTASFSVENFDLTVKTTDLTGNPKTSFSPGSKILMKIISKNENGDLMNLTNMSVKVTLPNGWSAFIQDQFTNPSTGIYVNEGNLVDTPPGTYRINVRGEMGGDVQTTQTGFSVNSMEFMVMAANMEFIDQADRGGGMVNAFSPNSNITLVTFLVNKSKGSMGASPEEQGFVTVEDCSESISLKITDSNGREHDVNYTAMNISEMAEMMAPNGTEPPEGMGSQCSIIIWDNNSWVNSTGVYSANVKIKPDGLVKSSRDSFGIQRMKAEGVPVDSGGNTNRFSSPNKTLYVKINAVDLKDRSAVKPGKITSASIISMHKEYPEFEDVYNQTYLNSSFDSSTNMLKFRAPMDEGFYSMKFRFKANLSGEIEEGVGKARFDLKEYIIYGMPEGSYIVSPDQNITIQVNVVDVSDGSYMFGSEVESVNPSCTGCTGMQFSVRSIWNEEMMKELDRSDYDLNISSGTITNESNSQTTLNIRINKTKPLPTGWYGLELVGNKSGKTYSGHVGFEIRKFFVETRSVYKENGTWRASEMGGGGTYQPGSPILFLLRGINPDGWEGFSLNNGEVEQVSRWDRPISDDEYVASSSQKTIVECYNDDCSDNNTFTTTVVNITGITDTGDYRAVMRGYKDTGESDIGSANFDIATFRVLTMKNGSVFDMEGEDTAYSSKSNLTVNFTGFEFSEDSEFPPPHNLSQDVCAEMSYVYSEETGDVRFDDTYYSPEPVTNNTCEVEMDLSKFPKGYVRIGFTIYDKEGKRKEGNLRIKITDMLSGIPRIEEMWADSESTSKELNVGQNMDKCRNDVFVYHEDYCNTSGQINPGDNVYCNRTICVQSDGMWNQIGESDSCDKGVKIWTVFNQTNMDVKPYGEGKPDYTKLNNSVGSTFSIQNDTHTWEVLGFGNFTEENTGFKVRHANGKICGDTWVCEDDNCWNEPLTITPPGNHSTFYFSPVRLIDDPYVFNLSEDETRVNVYHNTTHLWWNNTENLNVSGVQGPVAVGEVIEDPWGGKWKITKIYKRTVNLEGVNILPESGAFVNGNLSKSGTFRMGRVEEWWFGGDGGTDLNGDGDKEDRVRIIIADNRTEYIYNTLLFNGTGRSFTNPISVDDDPLQKTFADGKLTLLNIGPRGEKIKVYFNHKTGEWGDLGDYKYNSNISVPIVAMASDGTSVDGANVSITKLKSKGTVENLATPLTSKTNAQGVAEVNINLSKLGKQTGEYSFGVTIQNGSSVTELEEWMWPRAKTVNFLKKTRMSLSNYVGGFKPLPVHVYNWENYPYYNGRTNVELSSTDPSYYDPSGRSEGFDATFIATGNHEALSGSELNACNFDIEDANKNSTVINSIPGNVTYNPESAPEYYFYMGASNISKVWVKRGNCNFTNESGGKVYNVGDDINITTKVGDSDRTYYLDVLYANASQYNDNQEMVIGINNSDFNETAIEPTRREKRRNNTWFNPTLVNSTSTELPYQPEEIYWEGVFNASNNDQELPQSQYNWNSTHITFELNETYNKWNNSEVAIGYYNYYYTDKTYRIMALNISGTNYQVILANASYKHYVCEVENAWSCAKKAWISTTGNFSVPSGDYNLETGYPVKIGENFTSDLYIADLGPEAHSGIKIGNSSLINSRPGLGDVRTADGTTPYFSTITESSVGLDLDRNGSTNRTYYIITYDEREDGVKKTNEIRVDDDLRISESTVEINGTEYYLDQVGNETNMPEMNGQQPESTWEGYIEFDEFNSSDDSIPRYNRPNWRIKLFNTTDMLLFKDLWSVPVDSNATFYVKVSDFERNPVNGTNITSISLEHFTPFGIEPLEEGSDYTLENILNVTDKNGIGLIQINKNGTWGVEGHYRLGYTLESDSGTEKGELWFEGGFDVNG